MIMSPHLSEKPKKNLEKFATQVDSDILQKLRYLAHKEGRQLQALVNEALSNLIDQKTQEKPRDFVMAVYMQSHEQFGELYKKLAE
jgi:primosomal protein N''